MPSVPCSSYILLSRVHWSSLWCIAFAHSYNTRRSRSHTNLVEHLSCKKCTDCKYVATRLENCSDNQRTENEMETVVNGVIFEFFRKQLSWCVFHLVACASEIMAVCLLCGAVIPTQWHFINIYSVIAAQDEHRWYCIKMCTSIMIHSSESKLFCFGLVSVQIDGNHLHLVCLWFSTDYQLCAIGRVHRA